MNILLVYPQCPDSFWSFRHALKFISKKAAVPPLGLITISAMLPSTWQKKLVDMNISSLQEKDIIWADYVFISAMYIQKESVNMIIGECLKHNKKIVAGGPLFTQDYNNYPEIDHFVLNEAEITLPEFISDFCSGDPKKIYATNQYADITQTPVPDYQLLSAKDYASMNIQVSRGCPFACNFCEITSLLGHKVRMKKSSQILAELDALYYKIHWRGFVSIVDDNFIGNKNEIKNNLLPAIKKWMQDHNFPFRFTTETSIDIADDGELMSLMVQAGFNSTFIGIETPDEQSLHDCNKLQNKNRNLLQNIKKIQHAGLQVSGGFIIGFDSDTPNVFQQQIDFIQQSGIVSAMVGLLNAPKNTKLYRQLEAENRLTIDATGNNTDATMNFIPKMNTQELLLGYQRIIQNIYTTKPYYRRIRQFLLHYKRVQVNHPKLDISLIGGFFKSICIIGLLNRGRIEYWKLLIWTLLKRPAYFTDVITFTVYGYHFRIIYGLKS